MGGKKQSERTKMEKRASDRGMNEEVEKEESFEEKKYYSLDNIWNR